MYSFISKVAFKNKIGNKNNIAPNISFFVLKMRFLISAITEIKSVKIITAVCGTPSKLQKKITTGL